MRIRKHALRFSSFFLFLVVCLLVFSVKLVLIQVFRSSYLAGLAKKQHTYSFELEPQRGDIYDRQLRPLALSVSAFSLYANPRSMTLEDKRAAVSALSRFLDLSPEFIEERLSRKKYFVWLARKLSPEITKKIQALKIKGLEFVKESKRYYPNQYLAAHLIGFAGIDNHGLEGVELVYDQFLKGTLGHSKILRDARQRELMIEKDFVPPQDGLSIVLTIDETIQYIAERALERALKKYKAKAATIIIMDPRTGEILALANRPTFNLDNPPKTTLTERTNRAISYTYEPGSVFKLVTAAAALEEGMVRETDRFFCENGEYRVGNHILHDHHPHGILTFQDIIAKSSNIGVTKVAQRLGPNNIYKYGKRFRFGIKTGINLPGEVEGTFKNPSRWSGTSIGAIPIGHEVTVTPLQLAGLISTIANDGVYMQPFVVKYIRNRHEETVKEFKPQVIDQVVSAKTAKRLRRILNKVVEDGTGKMANIPGIPVGGKTGTAQKVVNGTYSHSKFYASFIGFAPLENPQVAAVVVFDEPYPNYYGGTVAAPVFKEVVENVVKYMDSIAAQEEETKVTKAVAVP